MITIKLNDDTYTELHILKESEWNELMYKDVSIFDKSIKTAFLSGYGTTLFFENRHFIIINDKKPLKKYAIWRNHKVIGYCEITKEAADKANKATNAEFYFGFDQVTHPEKY